MRRLTAEKHTTRVSSHTIGLNPVHDSAHKQVTGKAVFVDDIMAPEGCLFAYPVLSKITAGAIQTIDKAAIAALDGVLEVLSVDDVMGTNDIGPVNSGDPLLADKVVHYHGQPVLLIVAATHDQARRAARQAADYISIESTRPLLCIDEALRTQDWVRPPHCMEKGDVDKALDMAPATLTCDMHIGGQEHFYLEGQIALAIPQEDNGMLIQCSSQHPTEVQTLVAEVLAQPFSRVTVEVRRMGGAFGGKETQAAQWACLAALAASKTGRAVKLRLSRADDFRLTGKRHPFTHRAKVGFDPDGQVQAVVIDMNGHCGHSPDLSDAIVDRAMFHADNAYYYPHARITGHRARLNTHSNTAFRGFGAPQGMMIAERIMDDIACYLGKDPLQVRLANLYRPGRDQTVYQQRIKQFVLADMIQQLKRSAHYEQRRQAIIDFNRRSPIIRKGLALTPVKFGVSFTVQHLNQAGALLHIYTDGTVHLNHGGTEMGQGLNTKVAQIVAQTLGVGLDTLFISATRTDKVPNTSPTAASSGTDLNGMAALNAAETLKQRLVTFLSEQYSVTPEDIIFKDSQVTIGTEQMAFADVVQMAYSHRISLSATGFYKTPRIHYDRHSASGRPFFYFAHGAALAEVEIDSLSGENRVTQIDILHDVGRSLNPALDKGQIEGAFIQAMGWLTTEELVWADDGRLLSDSPATYKIPTIGDTPEHFNVNLYQSENPETTVFRSKAVGEPPFMLGISVWSALRHAVASFADYRFAPPLDPPATPENILTAIDEARAFAGYPNAE